MEDFFIKIYVAQIKDQINEAENSFSLMLANKQNHDILFSAIHHFIIHVSNIMKIIQPKEDDDFKKHRATSIRKKYPKLPTVNPKDIHVRNDFEHFDERIDYWVVNSKNHNYMDKSIGNISPSVAIKGLDPKDNFRWFDNQNMILHFCGESHDLNGLFQYIQNVKKVL
ncbi:hypothetical protein AMJ47_01260 [Parcubacteria bacterium DG_72]|nr:MAG: hypothetical protein AMJ47_01260 [Parcubacteria bacterium DG_72]